VGVVGGVAEGALDLDVVRVADERDPVAGAGEPTGLGVHFGRQRAGGVDDPQIPAGGVLAYGG